MDMLHFKHIVGSNMLKGISPIDVLKNTTDFDLLYVNSIYQKCKSDSFVLKYGSNIDAKNVKV